MTASDVEDTPLLAVQEHEKVYERFSTAQKRIIVGLVGWSAILPRKSACRLSRTKQTLYDLFRVANRAILQYSQLGLSSHLSLRLRKTLTRTRRP